MGKHRNERPGTCNGDRPHDPPDGDGQDRDRPRDPEPETDKLTEREYDEAVEDAAKDVHG